MAHIPPNPVILPPDDQDVIIAVESLFVFVTSIELCEPLDHNGRAAFYRDISGVAVPSYIASLALMSLRPKFFAFFPLLEDVYKRAREMLGNSPRQLTFEECEEIKLLLAQAFPSGEVRVPADFAQED